MVLFKVQAFFFKCLSEIKGTYYLGLILRDHYLWPSITDNHSVSLSMINAGGQCDATSHSEAAGVPKRGFQSARTAGQSSWTSSFYLQLHLASTVTQTTLHLVSTTAESGLRV